MVNHSVVMALSNLSILLCMAAQLVKRREVEAPDLYSGMAPVLRANLVLLYIYATVCKVNEGFLDPELSCAATMLE